MPDEPVQLPAGTRYRVSIEPLQDEGKRGESLCDFLLRYLMPCGSRATLWRWVARLVVVAALAFAGARHLVALYRDSGRNFDGWPCVAFVPANDREAQALAWTALSGHEITSAIWGSHFYGIQVPPTKARQAYRILREHPGLSESVWLNPPAVEIPFRGQLDYVISWHHVTRPQHVDGAVSFEVTGGEPRLSWGNLQIPASKCGQLVVRMRTDEAMAAGAWILWTAGAWDEEGPRLRVFEPERPVYFEVNADGEFHDIRLRVGDHPDWTGQVGSLAMELDVGDNEGAVAIQHVRPLDKRRWVWRGLAFGAILLILMGIRRVILRSGVFGKGRAGVAGGHAAQSTLRRLVGCTAAAVLVINGVVVCMELPTYVLRSLVASDSWLYIRPLLPGWYSAWVLPLTTVLAVGAFLPRTTLRWAGAVLVLFAAVLLVANYAAPPDWVDPMGFRWRGRFFPSFYKRRWQRTLVGLATGLCGAVALCASAILVSRRSHSPVPSPDS